MNPERFCIQQASRFIISPFIVTCCLRTSNNALISQSFVRFLSKLGSLDYTLETQRVREAERLTLYIGVFYISIKETSNGPEVGEINNLA